MKIRVLPSVLEGNITVSESKSILHRVIIAKYLSNKDFKIDNFSDDILATLKGIDTIKFGGNVIDCDNSGTTLRFLLPITLVTGDTFLFKAKESLRKRPLKQFLKVLAKNGCKFKLLDNDIFLEASGTLAAGEFVFQGDISSQYISSLLMVLPTLNSNSKILVKKPVYSKPYIDMTIKLLRLFNIKIEKYEKQDSIIFNIRGNQEYIDDREIIIEKDWSNRAFWEIANQKPENNIVLGETVANSIQGDSIITHLLRDFDSLEEINIIDIPDLFPILAVYSAYKKDMVFNNIKTLRNKESDRIKSITTNFNRLGIKTEEWDNAIKIFKTEKINETSLDSFNDHRIAMALIILGNIMNQVITVDRVEAINKSYPKFLYDFRTLGGEFYEV